MKNGLVRIVFFTCVLTSILPSSVNANVYALVVGNGDYPGTSSDRDYMAVNVEKFEKVLTDIYNVPVGNIASYYETVTTGVDFENKIKELFAHNDATMYILYWCGHGTRIGNSSIYSLPNGTFSDSELNTLLATTNVQTMVIVQHCHAGGFASNSGDNKTAVMTASSIDRTAWGSEGLFGWGEGSDFSNSLFDGFAWHDNKYATWASLLYRLDPISIWYNKLLY